MPLPGFHDFGAFCCTLYGLNDRNVKIVLLKQLFYIQFKSFCRIGREIDTLKQFLQIDTDMFAFMCISCKFTIFIWFIRVIFWVAFFECDYTEFIFIFKIFVFN